MPNYKIGIEVETDTNDSAKALGGITDATESLGDAMTGSGGGVKGLGAQLAGLVNPANLAAGAALGIGSALIATGQHAMELSSQVNDSTNMMQTQLGLTDERAGEFRDTMREIYADNYGGSFEDVASALTAVDQQFGRINDRGIETDEQLKEVTETAIAFSDAFESDVGESTSAVVTLMENFGLTSQEAFDFLVAGEQRGLDASGDFLDSIGEYSVQFSQAKADAGEFFSILESGNQGGVLGTDKVADAVKEFGIRIVDNSTTTKTALESIGINYDELTKGFQDGSITQIDAMTTVIAKIKEIQDPVQQNIVGVALFGTQWEDLSAQVLLSVDTQKTNMEDLEGAADSLNEQYDTNTAEIEAATRKWENALVDVGDELNQLGAVVLPWLADQMETFLVPSIGLLAEWIKNLQDGQNAWDAFINGLWQLGGDGPKYNYGGGDDNGDGKVGKSSLPAMAGAGAGGPQIVQQFYIDRGDPEVVRSAAELGIVTAQRVRGG